LNIWITTTTEVAFNGTEEQSTDPAIFSSHTDYRKSNFAVISHNETTAGTTLDGGKIGR
jgi:hypothetical protein